MWSQATSAPPSEDGGRRHALMGWLLAGVGVSAAVAGLAARPEEAGAAAAQNWSPFVLVAGLLLIGAVADHDGLFAAAGQRLARALPGDPLLFAGSAAMIGLVTAVLNLDTSVAFLTPVFVYTARRRGGGEGPLLYGCLLLSNAGSLFLPGSNLTNLIVVRALHLTGGQFFARMWPSAAAAIGVTAAVIAVMERRSLRSPVAEPTPTVRPTIGLGLAAIAAAAALIVALSSPALPVAAVGATAASVRVYQRRIRLRAAADTVGAPTLVGLFGLSMAVGTLARAWAGPGDVLAHLDTWGTAAAGAAGAVLLNNLPAAALLGARPILHPLALLIGLNLGPNLVVTGSLSWILWLRAAQTAGTRPSLAHASRLGAVAVPLSIVAAVAALLVTGPN